MKDNFDPHKWFKKQYLNEGDTLDEGNLDGIDYLKGDDVEQTIKANILKSFKVIEQYQNNLSPMGDEVELDYSEVKMLLKETWKAFDNIDISSLDPES